MSIRRPEGSPAPHDEIPIDAPTAPGGASRRQFFRGLGLGGAATAGAILLPATVLATAASAQESGDDAELDAADAAVLQALEALEAAAVEAYESALAITSLLPATEELFSRFHRHHEAHIDTLAEARGASETDSATPADTAVSTAVIGEVTAARSDDDIAGQERALYQAFYSLESSLAATYLVAMGQLTEATATAAVLGPGPVNGQQAYSLGRSLGLPVDEILPATQPVAGAYPLPAA